VVVAVLEAVVLEVKHLAQTQNMEAVEAEAEVTQILATA
tara:strand:- start:1512 stop:1628 length:117 start_codon:yes stop_codon:yes gene_type:complete